MSFTVRKVEDPTIYVRRNIKPDILGISSAWDNIVDIKETLNRLEDDVVAANKRPRLPKNTHSFNGEILQEISSETQHLGKVTRFQLRDEKSSHSDYVASKEPGTRRTRTDYSKISDISSVQKASYSGINHHGKDHYSPTRYTASAAKPGGTICSERPTYFETTTINPTILNDPPPSKESSFANTTVNSSSSSQQFNITSSPSFHGKAVLAKNEAALQKIKERVRKQQATLSKQDESTENSNLVLANDRRPHESGDHLTTSSRPYDTTDLKPAVPLKRKVGTIPTSGPTYKGFNAVSEPKQKKVEKQREQAQPKISKDTKNKVSSKPHQKQEKKATKGKMTRIVGSKRPQEVISTTSWRDGQANVKRILNAKKAKTSEKPPAKTDKTSVKLERPTRSGKAPIKNDKAKTTFHVGSHSQDELSEGRLSSDEDTSLKTDHFSARIEKFEAEKELPELNEDTVKPSENVSVDSDDGNDSKMKDVLSKEAQSMLADLAQDSSDSEVEIERDEKPKYSSPKRKMPKTKKSAPTQKTTEDMFPKGKTRHYDQAEVQKYMAHRLAERKKKQKQEKIQKKKQEEEKQQRLKDLYERQKKSFATTKKDKRFGKTFSFGDFDVRVPEGFDPENNEDSIKADQIAQSTSQSESDKENTDIEDARSGHERSSGRYTDDGDVTLTEDILTNETSRHIPAEPIEQRPSSVPFDERAQRLTALQATALALQSRLQSHALRLSGGKEGAVAQPAAKVSAQPREETGFQGVLPGVGSIRKQADENEKQSTRVAAATRIQAAYRGHTVRKTNQWTDEKTAPERSENTAPSSMAGHKRRDREYDQSEGSSDEVQFTNIRPFYKSQRLNNDLQRDPPKVERKFRFDDLSTRSSFLRNDFSAAPMSHFTTAPTRYEPKGDRFSVMNIFSRRHPTLPVDDILNDEPGSETASLLEVGRVSRREQNMEYEDDFTDVEMFSVATDGEMKKDSSKAETYSECFETDEDFETRARSKARRSPLEEKKRRTSRDDGEERQLSERGERTSPLSAREDVSSPNERDDFIMPVMASTMQPDTRSSPSISPSEENEPIRRRVYMKPADRTGGSRLSPDSLQRKLTAEINLLENVEDSVRQVGDIERTRAVSLAQQETVSLAQILKAKQQTHEQEMKNLRLKAKEEAIQAAKELEKTRQAAAMAAASAAERLAEVQTDAIKTNTEHSRKYMEEATRMTSGLLTNTSTQLAEFCKNLTSTTSAAVEDLHKTKRPTTTLVERGTSISEGHAVLSEHSSTSDDRTRTSDFNSNQSKSLESSPAVTSGRQQGGYSSDEFESYKSQTARHDGSDIKTEIPVRPSLSPESIAEDLPERSVSEDDTTVHDDDTTVHDESGNDTHDTLAREPNKTHDSVSSVLDYSSQFDDSSHAPTDEDIDFHFLLPSREHRRKSIKRIKNISFDEQKEKSVRTPFESDDSFGKFTADMIQQYMHEEQVRTKHQASILRLREKSLKEKSKAELQWLEQMKKRSRDKASDDVMPSLKKRERGIRMKLKAEKDEIKCLRAANRAATFQRRVMIYQQQEIQRLHQATLSIREKIQTDTSKKGSDHSSHEPSQSHARASPPASKPNAQSTPSSSSTKSKPSIKSPSTKSISEDISGEQGTSHVSPNTSGSPFPSYSTPKSEVANLEPSPTTRGEQIPETSNIPEMLSSIVEAGGQGGSNQNGELLKFHKMLLERQQKLAKDESEVNTMLLKVTEMLQNQRNLTTSRGSQSASTVSEASQSKQPKDASHSEQSIPEDISSVAKSVSEEVKDSAEKTANDYENCTFESDDSTPRSRRSIPQRMTSQTGDVNLEEELLSLTETSDQSDLEEKVRKLKDELQREKKKAEALERKKRKIKRSVMKKEALNLENELKNTRDDIHRKLAEIKSASAAAQTTTPTPASTPVKPHNTSPRLRLEVVLSPREEREKSSRRSTTPLSGNTSLISNRGVGHTSQVSDRGVGHTSVISDRGVESSSYEVEESLIEVLDDEDSAKLKEEKSQTKRPKSSSETSRASIRTKSETFDIPEQLPSNEVEESIVEILDGTPGVDRGVPPSERTSITPPTENDSLKRTSPVLAKDDSLDIPEELSEHIDSRSTTSIPEEVSGAADDQGSEIPEEISERSYTPIPSDASVSDESPKVAEDARSRTSSVSEESPKVAEDARSRTSSVSEDTFEHSYAEPRSTISDHDKSPQQSTKISEDLPENVETHLADLGKETSRLSDEHSYTEPESDTSNSDSGSHRLEKQPKSDAQAVGGGRKRSDASEISKSSGSEISQKTITSSRISRSTSTTEDEKSESDQQDTKVSQTVPELQLEIRSVEKESGGERSKSPPDPDEAKTYPRVGVASPRYSASDAPESRSEASSIAEEIASGYDDENISETRSVKDQLSPGLISGDEVKHELERKAEDASGLDGKELNETRLDQPGLAGLNHRKADETGLDQPGLSDHKADETGLDEPGLVGLNHRKADKTGLDQPGLSDHKADETGLDQPGLSDHRANETGFTGTGLEPGFNRTELMDPEVDERGIGDGVDCTDTLTPLGTATVVSPQISVSKKSSRSQGSESSRPREAEDEPEYSDDFDDDASIPEEISEIIEEFSEKAEDSDVDEDFAVFTSRDKIVEDAGYEPREVKEDSGEAESRGKRMLDDITDNIYRDIIADSLTTMKNVKTSKDSEKTSSSDNKQPNSKVLTNAFSTVTKKIVDSEGQSDTHKVISGHEDITKGHTDTDVVPTGRRDAETTTGGLLDEIGDIDTQGHVGTDVDTRGQTATDRDTEGHDGYSDTRGDTATDSVPQVHVDTGGDTSGQTGSERGEQEHQDTDSITRALLTDAIMQMIEIKQRKKERDLKLVAAVDKVEEKPHENKTPGTTPPTGETQPAKSSDVTLSTGTSSPVNIPGIESPTNDETAIDNALMIAKSNQTLDDDALRTIDDDIKGLLGTPLDDEDDFPVNETNFSDIPSDDNEPSLPEFSPMLAVPHTTQELTPMANSTIDVLLEQKLLGMPLDDCVPQARFLAGETEAESESVSIRSYRHLVFDLTKEVFMDIISQNEPVSRPPWARWKSGQKLSRNFKRSKSDDEIRAAVLERVTNVIGLGAPRATMATLPRKTPVRGNKKDNVDAILIEELRQEEPVWTDYEDDETAVKFQVADAILNMLLEDTARVFNAIEAKKHVPDNVLVV